MADLPRPARLLALTIEDDPAGSGYRWAVLENFGGASGWECVQRAPQPLSDYAAALRLGTEAMDALRDQAPPA